MAAGSASNVVSIRRGRADTPMAFDAATTVLHAVACDDDLAEVASVVAALQRRPAIRQIVVHASEPVADFTGGQIGIDHRLNIGEGTPGQRTAAALIAFERLLTELQPQIVVVTGDDDVMVAAAMAAAKQSIAVAHLGSGLRTHDWTLADEVNRTVIDRLSDTLFTLSDDGGANLLAEGVPDGRIHFVGNTRIDVLRRSEARARKLGAWQRHGFSEHAYTLVALQRADSLAGPGRAESVLSALTELATHTPVLLVHHPRTEPVLSALAADGIAHATPSSYLESLSLLAGAGAVVTDAASVQDDASALGVRCFTFQQNTPRTTTLTHGTNVLLGCEPAAIASVSPTRCAPTPAVIPLWDGRAGERVADTLAAHYTLAAAFGRDQ